MYLPQILLLFIYWVAYSLIASLVLDYASQLFILLFIGKLLKAPLIASLPISRNLFSVSRKKFFIFLNMQYQHFLVY